MQAGHAIRTEGLSSGDDFEDEEGDGASQLC